MRFGCAIAQDADDVQPLLLEDLFKMTVFVDSSAKPNVMHHGVMIPVAELVAKHTVRDVTVPVGNMGTPAQCKCGVLDVPRHSVCLVWSCLDLYKLLRMQSHKGLPSHWAHQALPRLEKALTDLGFGAGVHTFKSVQSSKEAAFLPFPALSSICLLVTLTRFAVCSSRAGGLQEETSRACSLEYLQALLKVACTKGHRLDIELNSLWSHKWPATSASDVSLLVSEGLMVDLSLVWERVQDQHACAIALWRECASRCHSGRTVPLTELLATTVQSKGCKRIFSQLVCQLGLFLDAVVCCDSLRQEAEVEASSDSWMDLLQEPKRLRNQLAKYVFGGMRLFQNSRHISLANDKANVGGLQLNMAVLVSEENVAVLAPAQVSTREKENPPTRVSVG